MTTRHRIRAAGAVAALALAIPASASAVPIVDSVEARLDKAGVTFLTDPTGGPLPTQQQYTVNTDGYVLSFAETNGVTADGVVNYAVLPKDFRAPATSEEKRTYVAAQTGLQAHATCAGVPKLAESANILAWQGTDPYYNYVPFQKASAGLGDDPAKWIPVVKTATGVDLSTVADAKAACTGLGGTYQAADTSTAVASQLIANAVAPLNTKITGLDTKVASLTKDVATAKAATTTAKDLQKAAEVAYQDALFNREVIVTPSAKRLAPGHVVALLTGSVTDPVDVTLEVTAKVKKKLKLSSRVLSETTTEFSTQGATIVTLKPSKADLKKLGKSKKAVKATIKGVSSGKNGSTPVTLVP